MTHHKSVNKYLSDTISANWEQPALTDFNGVSYSFRDIARKIAKLHILYERCRIKPGDKVAICGRNSSNWAVAFLATMSYGAVNVPILSDFKPDSIHNLVNHSESKLFFVEEGIWENLDPTVMRGLTGVLTLKDNSLILSRSEELTDARAHLNQYFGHKYPERFVASDFIVYDDKPDELALINYTSGSTGFPKGVMLTYENIWSNLEFCLDKIDYISDGDGIVSMLPMAHMYGLMIEIIFPIIRGCHIHFLTRTPSPRVITEAFAKVHPKMIVSVPLILEKIIKTQVFPLLEKPLMRVLMHVPFVDSRLLARIKAKLQQTFGGNLEEIIIGGAKLNKDVELFLRKIGFQFTIGYGMTECCPLISYSSWREARAGSCGKVVDRMEVMIDSPDPYSIPGVLYTRGSNVMKGYFKNPEATKAELSEDGWLNTGDISLLDSEGFLYLKGRNKNMILGPSGQNIYPEEIEQILNNMPYVNESVVISESNRLIALIYPDYELASNDGLSSTALEQAMKENVAALNKDVPTYSKVSSFRLMDEEFEKTPKRSIKRYLYQHNF